VLEAITTELYALDGSDDQFRERMGAALEDGSGRSVARWAKLQKDEVALAQQRENVTASIAEYGPMPFIKQKLLEIETVGRALARERGELESVRKRTLDLPQSTAALRAHLEKAFATLSVDSWAFGDLLRKLVPNFEVYLVRLCDGGHLLPRARVTLALDGLLPDARDVPGLSTLLGRTRTLDLFIPPQRERIRERVIYLAADGLGPKAIAARIAQEGTASGGDRPTATAVQNSLALQRKMRQLGLENPYVTVLAPPEDYPKLRRHRNAKYHFERQEGYEPTPIEAAS
jgi:hypothetical protein